MLLAQMEPQPHGVCYGCWTVQYGCMLTSASLM